MKRNVIILSFLFVGMASFGQQARIDIGKDSLSASATIWLIRVRSSGRLRQRRQDIRRFISVIMAATARVILSGRWEIMTNLTLHSCVPTAWAS